MEDSQPDKDRLPLALIFPSAFSDSWLFLSRNISLKAQSELKTRFKDPVPGFWWSGVTWLTKKVSVNWKYDDWWKGRQFNNLNINDIPEEIYILFSQSFSRFLDPIKYISSLMRALCLSSQSNLQILEFGNIFFRRNTKSDIEFKYKAETIDISLKINYLRANRYM